MRIHPLLRMSLSIAAGIGIGYLYYRYFGCTSGCALTSSPAIPMLTGGLLGLSMSLPESKEKGE